jgi:3-isopropylmalate/(R)-2-methylmalate dehydratase large subunit
MSNRTIVDKIWEAHTLAKDGGGRDLLYVDRHLVHEVTSPMAFEELRARGLRVRRPDLTVAVMDHNVPTGDRSLPIADELCANQLAALKGNATEFGLSLFDYTSPYQGISHVIFTELGLTLPGMTLTCGDSHTATHGAFGALAFGIGTSEVAHVLATQTLWIKKPKSMEMVVNGKMPYGVTAKDVALALLGRFGVNVGFEHIMEYRGATINRMSMDERMTLCNMSVEGGARTAIVSPDETTLEYLKKRPCLPKAEAWEEMASSWRKIASDPGAEFDRSLQMDVANIEPQVTWGTNPSMVSGVTGTVPDPRELKDDTQRHAVERAIRYMGLRPGMKIEDITIDRVFIGSCTNGRLSDLMEAAKVVAGKKVNRKVRAMVVPGSQVIKREAEKLGLHQVFLDAGFEWRNSGCSLCLGMNEDKLLPGERSASTSNRNFEDRQGPGGRTHLVSPLMAGAAAIEGHFVDVREWDQVDIFLGGQV